MARPKDRSNYAPTVSDVALTTSLVGLPAMRVRTAQLDAEEAPAPLRFTCFPGANLLA